MPDRFFNMLFVISPQGEVVHRAAKNHLWCRGALLHAARRLRPLGRAVRRRPRGLLPRPAHADIGNIGTICCSDGEYPEAIRALAFNGAEVIYRPSEAVPMTQAGPDPGGTWLLQNRAHAHFNNVYMVCPNVGPVYVHPAMEHPYDIGGGGGARGRLPGQRARRVAQRCEQLLRGTRRHRGAAQLPHDEPELQLDEGPPHEVFRTMYDEPIHPANLWLHDDRSRHAEVDEVYRANIQRLIDRGSWTPPAHHHPGSRVLRRRRRIPPMPTGTTSRVCGRASRPDRAH